MKLPLRANDVNSIAITGEDLRFADRWLTSERTLRANHVEADSINPGWCSSFDDLMARRQAIRSLKLLPIKTPEEHDRYNGIRESDPERLVREVAELLGGEEFVLAENAYPYWAPPGTTQLLLWVADPSVSREQLKIYLATCVKALGLKHSRLICFERPVASKVRLVKGTFKAVRHIHLWVG